MLTMISLRKIHSAYFTN